LTPRLNRSRIKGIQPGPQVMTNPELFWEPLCRAAAVGRTADHGGVAVGDRRAARGRGKREAAFNEA